MRNKFLLIAVGVIAVISLFWTANTFAQNSTSQYPPIIQRIVQKFGLKEEDVKAVFDEERQARQKEMQARYETWLDQLVKDGKITNEQKQLILNKHKELQQNRQLKRQELIEWANQNGIDPKYVMGFGMRGFGTNHWKSW